MGIWVCPHCGKTLPRSMWDDRMRTAKVHPSELATMIEEAREVQREQSATADSEAQPPPPVGLPPINPPPLRAPPPVGPPYDPKAAPGDTPPSWDPNARTDPGSFTKRMRLITEARDKNTVMVATISASIAIVAWNVLEWWLRSRP